MNAAEISLNNMLTQEKNQYIIFSIDNDEFGVEIERVHEIIGYIEPTFVPNMPEFLSGVIKLRETIIPIIDLRNRFNIPLKAYDKFTVIVIVEVESKMVGLIVDGVSDVVDLDIEDIHEISGFSQVDTEYIKGMGKLNNRLIVTLDIEKILSHDEYKKLNHVEENN